MTSVPDNLRYARTHEWVEVNSDIATIGISDHAQSELGDVTYVGLPEQGRIVQAGTPFGEVESVKAVSELYSPVSGEVVEVNSALTDRTETVNEDAYGAWLIRVRMSDPTELAALLPAAEYRALAEEGGH